MNWGRAIATIRAAKGVGQVELAERACILGGMVSLIETGKRTPSLETLTAIAASLQVPLVLLTFLASDRSDLTGVPINARDLLAHLTIEALR